MQLQQKPTSWSCLSASFAMALGISTEELFGLIGHDGSEIIFPHLDEPMCRRGHHVQECVLVAQRLGVSSTPYELFPTIGSTDGTQISIVFHGPNEETNWRIANNLIRNTHGVIDGRGHKCGHAVAYDHGRILDPDGREYKFSRADCEVRNFYMRCIWRLELFNGAPI